MPFYPDSPQPDPKKEKEEGSHFFGVPMKTSAFTFEEIEKMRSAVMEHDRNRPPNVFDISKPPVEPYEYREFPKTLYLHEKCKAPFDRERVPVNGGAPYSEHVPAKFVTKTVTTKTELERSLKQGWQEKPPVFHKVETEEPIPA